MKRSGFLRRTSTLRRRTALRPLSDRRRAILEDRAEVRALVLARDPICRFPGCFKRSRDVHELKSRARGGSILNVDNACGVCRKCHSYLHNHPKEAERLGLLIASWVDGKPESATER